MLKLRYSQENITEAGTDEAGRGCLAGPVFAASVILPANFNDEMLNDSKKLSPRQRDYLRSKIEAEAAAWSVASVSAGEIDRINILNASILAMHKALDGLKLLPQLILVDGNRFKPYRDINHYCIVKGDGIYLSIAAASVLAKTHRDEFMMNLHNDYPQYQWDQNKGYPTEIHRKAIFRHGYTNWHRKTFRVSEQLSFDLR